MEPPFVWSAARVEPAEAGYVLRIPVAAPRIYPHLRVRIGLDAPVTAAGARAEWSLLPERDVDPTEIDGRTNVRWLAFHVARPAADLEDWFINHAPRWIDLLKTEQASANRTFDLEQLASRADWDHEARWAELG